MKRTVFLFVFACMTCMVNAQIGAIARTFRSAYLAVSAIRAQKQIQEQQRKLTMECLQKTRHVELLSTEQMQLTLAHSTTIEHVLPLTMNLPQDDKTQKMTSGSTNGVDNFVSTNLSQHIIVYLITWLCNGELSETLSSGEYFEIENKLRVEKELFDVVRNPLYGTKGDLRGRYQYVAGSYYFNLK